MIKAIQICFLTVLEVKVWNWLNQGDKFALLFEASRGEFLFLPFPTWEATHIPFFIPQSLNYKASNNRWVLPKIPPFWLSLFLSLSVIYQDLGCFEITWIIQENFPHLKVTWLTNNFLYNFNSLFTCKLAKSQFLGIRKWTFFGGHHYADHNCVESTTRKNLKDKLLYTRKD